MTAKIEWVHWITASNCYSKSHAFKNGAADAMCGEPMPKSSVISIRQTDDTCERCTVSVSKLRREERS